MLTAYAASERQQAEALRRRAEQIKEGQALVIKEGQAAAGGRTDTVDDPTVGGEVKSELAAAMAQHQVRSFTIRAWLTTALVHTYATSLKVHRSSGCPRLANTHHHHHRTVVSCTERRSDCPRSTTPLI